MQKSLQKSDLNSLGIKKVRKNISRKILIIEVDKSDIAGVGVLSLKTLSSKALSSKEHWSNGTLVERNLGRTEPLAYPEILFGGGQIEQRVNFMNYISIY